MRMRWLSNTLRPICIGLALLWLGVTGVGAETPTTRITYPRHESGATSHTDYYFEVLQTALERTRAQFGPYALRYSEMGMNPARAFKELSAGSGVIDVDVRSWSPERSKALLHVAQPLDRGLIGYRLLLIRREDQAKFDRVRTLEDLRAFRFGLLGSWGDVRIFEQNRLPVVTGSSFEGLFKMLDLGRFDAFSRDVNEIQSEIEQRRTELPNLTIERGLLLRYPAARYFFVSKTPVGMQLAKRLEEGLRQMQADGSLDALFRKHRGEQIAKLDLRNRRTIQLRNPQLPGNAPALPAELLPASPRPPPP